MDWIWITVSFLLSLVLVAYGSWVVFFYYSKWNYYGMIFRMFQEKPLLNPVRGEPIADAEEVDVWTSDGLRLQGCYWKTRQSARRGVILFGLEYGANRWACVPYCEFLNQQGYDIFTVEVRNQGDSDSHPNYDPLQWVTDHEVRDMQAAIDYLKDRPDADPHGIGFFGISKGAAAGTFAATKNDYVRCVVTDSMFATHSTTVTYMRRWIYLNAPRWLVDLVPTWYFGMFARMGLKQIGKERSCRYPKIESHLRKLAPRPLLMIHGKSDSYIRPNMVQDLFATAREPKELWLVKKAKHNQAFQVATAEYQHRLLEFFGAHLDQPTPREHLSATENRTVKVS